MTYRKMQHWKVSTAWREKPTAAASSLRRFYTTSELAVQPIFANASSRLLWPMPSSILKSPRNGFQWIKKHGRDSTEKNRPSRLPEARRNLPHGARPGVRPRDQENSAGSRDSK